MEIMMPYNLRFVSIVAAFIEEVGRCYGADNSEKKRLRLIGEEAFTFIINGIPDHEFDEQFHLKVVEQEYGLSMQFSNHGRPMDVREIPEFTIEDHEGTSDGLSLRLLQNMCDELSFRNLGRKGWELLITFRINQEHKIAHFNDTGSVREPEEESEIICRKAVAEDVPGIINLVYNTYRYSYIKDLFYDKNLLGEAIQSRKVLSVIAIAGKGRIVGHAAVFLDSDILGEAGMAMVDPRFRGGNILMAMKRTTAEELVKDHLDILIYAKTVTSHKASQAFVARYIPGLINLSVYHHASFIGISGESNSRESLIYFLTRISPAVETQIINIPAEHYDIVKTIFSDLGIPADLITNNQVQAEDESRFEINMDTEKQHASILLTIPGRDLVKSIRQETRKLQQEGIITIDFLVNTTQNQDAALDSILLQNGYFFCGLKPTPSGSWIMVYTNLLHQKFDFVNLQIFSPKAKSLCEYVQSQYLKTL